MKVQFTAISDDAVLHRDLTPGNVYRVIGLEADYIRLMSDEGLPYCYPSSLFTVVDDKWPNDWVVNRGEDGELYASPVSVAEPGFFEKFFDGDKEARITLRKRLQRWRTGED